ncbi:helix-turn-helix transcriptional regulator [Bifidobacterium saguini]|nr:helix-turn-helix transcriptional regulator [Bifidobacterium saguini]
MIQNLRKLMRANHVKQRELASVLGVSEQAVSDKFHGRTNFTLRDLSRIADYFDVSLDYLTGRSDYAKPLEVA